MKPVDLSLANHQRSSVHEAPMTSSSAASRR
jgi:hypothetical protein